MPIKDSEPLTIDNGLLHLIVTHYLQRGREIDAYYFLQQKSFKKELYFYRAHFDALYHFFVRSCGIPELKLMAQRIWA